MLWHGEIPDDLPSEEIAAPTSEVAWIDKRTDDERSVKRRIGRCLTFCFLKRYPGPLQLSNPLIPLLVELAIVRDDHRKADASRDAKWLSLFSSVVYLEKVRI